MPRDGLKWMLVAPRLLAVLVAVFFCATASAQSPYTQARPPIRAAPENFSSITVPNVVGLPYAKARTTLEGLRLTPVPTSASRVDLATAGVAAQQPPAGTRVVPGTRIMLALAAPRPSGVTVPNVIGRLRMEAEAMLKQSGLGWRVQQDRPAGAESRVAAQQPRAGTQLPAGSVVILSLTPSPAATVAVPNLVGRTLAEAELLLRQQAPGASLRSVQAAHPTAKITSQEPKAGTRLEPRATITVTVEAVPIPGPAMTTVPAIIDHKLADARRAASDARLHLTLPDERPAPADDVMIVGQDPAAGRRVPVGSSVRATLAPALAMVPPLVGTTVRVARDKLRTAKLALALPADRRWPEDATIARQQPAAGTKVALGSEIHVAFAPVLSQPAEPTGNTVGDTTGQAPSAGSTTPSTIDLAGALRSLLTDQRASQRPADAAPIGPSVPPQPATGGTTQRPNADTPRSEQQPNGAVNQVLSWTLTLPGASAAGSLVPLGWLIRWMWTRWRRRRLRATVRVLLIADGGHTTMHASEARKPEPAISLRLVTSPPVTKLHLAA